MTDLVGKTLLDRYFLREHLGSGGMADVYVAWDNLRSTAMAVKVLRRDLSTNKQFSHRFRREAELLRKLEHPIIARIYEFERDGDIAFLVMDWVQGQSLNKLIDQRNKAFTAPEVNEILGPISTALHYAHKKNVYHCDVKPANILMHKDGRVFLTDFGVARLATENLTGGTPPYMAPEQIRKEKVNERTDIYGLGITIYEMLSGGKVPYRGNSVSSQGSTLKEKVKWEHLHLPLPPLNRFNNKISSSLSKIVEKALHKEPNRRYSDVLEFSEAFKKAAANDHDNRTTFLTDLQDIVDEDGPTKKIPFRKRWKTIVSRNSTPNLHCRNGEYNQRTIQIPREGLRVGRSSQNQLILKERSVSRMHAVVYITPEGAFIRDENSSLGTLLNGQRITGIAALQHGDVIQIGYEQVFEYRER